MESQIRTKRIWLIGLIALTLLMIAVGGATRLTRSGLSIVEWKPVTGILPPIGNDAWNREFDKYKASPEYQKVNAHFELSDYKKIFFWEYIHRVLGRLIFLYTLIPGLILWRRSIVSGKLVSGLTCLVLVQGLMGWIMVKSGLNHEPRVSPFLLATHFFLALTLMIAAYFQISKMRTRLIGKLSKTDIVATQFLGLILVLQIFYGCLTSGFKAGIVSNTFPLMHGSLFPSAQLLNLSPIWINIFENPHMVQWIHRWLGVTVVFLIYAVTFLFFKKIHGANRRPFIHLVGISTAQLIFGISLLLWQVPLWLAMLHQIIAALIVLAYCNIVFRLERAN